MMTENKVRCQWVNQDPLYIYYHDHEWGVPVYDDRLLFEFLILESMQAGLSWLTVLKKRDNYRACFDNFSPKIIANYDKNKLESLMQDARIIRHRLKIQSIVANAKAFLQVKQEFKSFSHYLWSFVNHHPIQNHWKNASSVPTATPISDHLSQDLKKRGFKFVGSTICYAFMQAVGMVNDHTMSCFRYQMLKKLSTPS